MDFSIFVILFFIVGVHATGNESATTVSSNVASSGTTGTASSTESSGSAERSAQQSSDSRTASARRDASSRDADQEEGEDEKGKLVRTADSEELIRLVDYDGDGDDDNINTFVKISLVDSPESWADVTTEVDSGLTVTTYVVKRRKEAIYLSLDGKKSWRAKDGETLKRVTTHSFNGKVLLYKVEVKVVLNNDADDDEKLFPVNHFYPYRTTSGGVVRIYYDDYEDTLRRFKERAEKAGARVETINSTRNVRVDDGFMTSPILLVSILSVIYCTI